MPQVLAFHDDPQAAVLAHIDGRDDFNNVKDDAERESILESFLELLAELHSVDARKFEAIGLRIPGTPEELALHDLDVWQSTYEGAVREPLPLLTFACQWLRRNVPRKPVRPVLCQGDTGPGNLMFADGKVTALVDFELAHLADPMTDLACVRSRDLYTPLGRFPERLARYAELSGREIDFDTLLYYSVKTQALVPLSLAPVMENLHAGIEHAEWIAQHVFYMRTTAEVLAEAIGVELAPGRAAGGQERAASRPTTTCCSRISKRSRRPRSRIRSSQNRMWFTSRLARHLRTAERKGDAFEAQELDDMGELLGRRPRSVRRRPPRGRRLRPEGRARQGRSARAVLPSPRAPRGGADGGGARHVRGRESLAAASLRCSASAAGRCSSGRQLHATCARSRRHLRAERATHRHGKTTLEPDKHRLTCELIVDRQAYPAVVRDLAPTGLFVQTRVRPDPNSVVEVRFPATAGVAGFPVEAGVARHRNVHPRLQAEIQSGIGLEVLGRSADYLALASRVLPEARSEPDELPAAAIA